MDRYQTGTVQTSNCSTEYNGNVGCKSTVNESNNYGDEFNRNGGGVSGFVFTSILFVIRS